MPQVVNKVIGAMFDVKPVDTTGRVDFAKIRSVPKRINLRNAEPTKIPLTAARIDQRIYEIPITQLPVAAGAVLVKEDALRELEAELAGVKEEKFPLPDAPSVDPQYEKIVAEMRRGQRLIDVRRDLVPPARPVRIAPKWRTTHAVAKRAPSSTSRMRPQELDSWFHVPVADPSSVPLALRFAHVMHPAPAGSFAPRTEWQTSWLSPRTVIAGIVALMILAGGSYVFSLKRQVVEDGAEAFRSLERAQSNIEVFDFAGASSDFSDAYDAFTSASNRLNDIGSRISSWVSELPGGEKLESAQSITKVGALIADTGKSMAQAVDAISKTGFLLNPQSNSRFLLSEVLGPLREALAVSDKNLSQAEVLVQDIDSSVIPEEKRDLFETFRSKLPAIATVVKNGQDYIQFLENVMGIKGTRRYLILFQNTTELRPTGGFPGNYGVLTVEGGKIKSIFVDDVYNLDGQLKDAIVPPKQLQHITPTWGMRDSSWFTDFPTSARKAMSLFRKEAGYDVDGVITISPKVIQDMLKIVGPIDMPAYHMTLASDNFLPEIQNEVEYGENKKLNQSKKIIADLAPIVLERLYSAQPSTWLSIFQTLVANIGQKEMMMYFRDNGLEDIVLRNGSGGQISATNDDYLMVNISNVKGAKTDAVTDTVMSLHVRDDAAGVRHILRITRTHNGGSSQYGFYNRQNPSFIRVLVPQGAKLENVSGASAVNYQPLVDYSQKGFVRDPDLEQFEATFHEDPATHAAQYEEAGKTGFAFWMVVDPGATQTVEIEYIVPQLHLDDTYGLLVQKQPGLSVRSFDFQLVPPDGVTVTAATPVLHQSARQYTLSQPLEGDLTIRAQLQKP